LTQQSKSATCSYSVENYEVTGRNIDTRKQDLICFIFTLKGELACKTRIKIMYTMNIIVSGYRTK